MALTHGMNIEEIEAVGSRLQRHFSANLTTCVGEIELLVGDTRRTWMGSDADRFRSWWPSHRAKMTTIIEDIHGFGQAALNNAAEQRMASGADTAAQQIGSVIVRSGTPFDSMGSGRADVIESFWATGDERRAEFDEIEIRQLDNGRWVVVLPGVADLSDNIWGVVGGAFGGNAVGPWYDGDQPDTLRRMEYAIGESQDVSDSFQNPYALRVIELMEDAGIPPGGEVMFVGHSFGAYTAMELAGNPMFNSADGSSAGYHVNVTHVVAAGADTNWKFAEIPPETNALVLNNRYDAAFQVEDDLVPDVDPVHEGHLNIEFRGQPTFREGSGFGHDPSGYVKWLGAADDRPELNQWLEEAGSKYSSGGTAYAVKVQDFQ